MINLFKKRTHCKVHSCELQEGTASVIYGNVFHLKKFEKKRRKLCPKAHTAIEGGCLSAAPYEEKVLYCPECRIVEEELSSEFIKELSAIMDNMEREKSERRQYWEKKINEDKDKK